jgi:hypothetical protein
MNIESIETISQEAKKQEGMKLEKSAFKGIAGKRNIYR